MHFQFKTLKTFTKFHPSSFEMKGGRITDSHSQSLTHSHAYCLCSEFRSLEAEFPQLGIAGQCKRSRSISAECRQAEDVTLPDIKRSWVASWGWGVTFGIVLAMLPKENNQTIRHPHSRTGAEGDGTFIIIIISIKYRQSIFNKDKTGSMEVALKKAKTKHTHTLCLLS